MRKKTILFAVSVCLFSIGFAQKKGSKEDQHLYLTQLKAAEAFYRLNQIEETKKILEQVNPAFRGWEWQLLNARADRSVYTLRGHNKPVIGIAVSADGKYLASGSADSTIIIWDAGSYRSIKKIAGHRGQVTTLDFSPDGKWLITGSTDKTLRLWNVATGVEEKNFGNEFSQGIYQAKFSPDGKKIGAVSWEFANGNVQGFAKLIDPETGKLLNRINTDVKPASAIDFSPDGKKIFTGTWNFLIKEHDLSLNNSVVLYDLTQFNYYTAIQSIDVSPDGKLLAESGKDNRIRILQADGKLIHQIEPWQGHSQWVNCVRFSPDGKYVASAADDGLLKIWETGSATNMYTFRGHAGGLFQLVWHPDGKRIFTSSGDGTIKVWSLEKPGDRVFDVAENGPWCAPVTADGKYLVSAASDRRLTLWDLNTGTMAALTDTFGNNAAIISGDATFVAAAGYGRTIDGYDIARKKKLFSSPGHTAGIFGIGYSKQLKLVASAGDKAVRVWSADGGKLLQTLPTLSNAYVVQFSPDNKLLIAGCTDGKVKIFSTATWQLADSLQAGTSILCLAIHSNGKYLVTAGANGQAFVYDLPKRKLLHELKGHVKIVYGLAIHPTAPIVVTVGFDRVVKTWNLETGINTLTLYGFADETYTAAIVNNGNRLVITETDGDVHVIDLFY